MSETNFLNTYTLQFSRKTRPNLYNTMYDSIQDEVDRCSAPTDSPSDVDGVVHRVTTMLCLHIFSLDQSLGFSLSIFISFSFITNKLLLLDVDIFKFIIINMHSPSNVDLSCIKLYHKHKFYDKHLSI